MESTARCFFFIPMLIYITNLYLFSSMKKKLLWILLSVVGVIGLGVCIYFLLGLAYYAKGVVTPQQYGGVYMDDMTSSYSSPKELRGYGVSEIGTVTGTDTNTNVQLDTKIRKNGYVNLLVSNIDKSISSLKDIVKQKDGTILNSHDSGEGNDRYVDVQIKVDSTNFEDVMDMVLKLDGDLDSSSVDTQDITQEYMDTQARLNNLKNVEGQLTEILKSASSVTDTLAVYRELTDIRGQIDVLEGQIKYMDSQTDYSYITVVFAVNKEGLNVAQDDWKPVGEFKLALASLVGVIKGLGNVLIWVIVFSPLVLIPLGIVLVVKKKKKDN